MSPRNFAYSVTSSVLQALMLGYALTQCYQVAENTKIPLPILLAAGDLATKGVLAFPEQVVQPTVNGIKKWLKRNKNDDHKEDEQNQNEEIEKPKRLKMMETDQEDEVDNEKDYESMNDGADLDNNDEFEEDEEEPSESNCSTCSKSDEIQELETSEEEESEEEEPSAGEDALKESFDNSSSEDEEEPDEEDDSTSSDAENVLSAKRTRFDVEIEESSDSDESVDQSFVETQIEVVSGSQDSPARSSNDELSGATSISPFDRNGPSNDEISKKRLRDEVSKMGHPSSCAGDCNYGRDCDEAKIHLSHLARCWEEDKCGNCRTFDAFLWRHVKNCQMKECTVPTCSTRKSLRGSAGSHLSQ
jgi:hypothetical protein